jgi:hypothetical protein
VALTYIGVWWWCLQNVPSLYRRSPLTLQTSPDSFVHSSARRLLFGNKGIKRKQGRAADRQTPSQVARTTGCRIRYSACCWSWLTSLLVLLGIILEHRVTAVSSTACRFIASPFRFVFDYSISTRHVHNLHRFSNANTTLAI